MTSSKDEFRARVLVLGEEHYRDMPWRRICDAYGILVSEVMLQQTQVARAMERWPRFMAKFPTVDALAAADTAEVLTEWQGMGYNRRALNLKRACEQVSAQLAGVLPETAEELQSLPGIGPATAAGVVAFAYDKPAVYLETNVRTVFIHEFFADAPKVSDSQLIPLVRDCCPDAGVRTWYYALLDYGAYLKASLGRQADPARRSSSYARQSPFEGSHRQRRASLLREVLASPGIAYDEAHRRLSATEIEAGRQSVDAREFASLVDELAAEGFFSQVVGTLVP
ncbi:MAG: adenine glycosylase [Eggerthellaceae bacterium]|nr:adenine glycosylase [Eggerthellaceae bacterium]